jgi:DNA polymerase I-like protein with 3'-5' exonuclease and polymerase domains
MITLDIETTTAMDHIWCCGLHITGEKRISVMRNPRQVMDKCSRDQVFVGHNIVNFDAPKLKELWNVVIPDNKLRDTLLMSRLWNPRLSGGHSLEAWGERLGYSKIDFTDYDGGLSEEMITYCKRDVSLTVKLEEYLTTALSKDGFSDESIQLEHEVAVITSEQERNGFKLDIGRANELLTNLMERMNVLEREVQEVFPPLVEERVSEKTGKKLKDKVTVFNLGSRKQIASRLQEKGIVFKDQTEKGNIIVNEKTLASIDLPEARLIGEYLTLQKRVGQIDNWVNAVADDGRVHGRCITNGAVSGRMTHQSPNMAQVPSSKTDKVTGMLLWGRDSWYGTDCRACWIVDEGNVLVGIDASGLELRMLAHYMNDKAYTKQLLEGDIHTYNQKMAGLETRDQAKTFVYALIYGGGSAKIGQIAGGSSHKGKQLVDKFMSNLPAYARLKKKVLTAMRTNGTLQGLDGRRLRVESEHSALNFLLQSAGAVVMKKALVILHEKLTKRRVWFKIVANVHDEWQIETTEDKADEVGELGRLAIKEAGEWFSMNCPLDGDYKVGHSWAETH